MAARRGGAYACHGRRGGARRAQRGAEGPTELGQLELLVLLHFVLGPAKQKAQLVVHFTFLCTATMHKYSTCTGSVGPLDFTFERVLDA